MCEVKEYNNYQTSEKLDLERVSQLKDNAMLKNHPELWCIWNFEKNEELDLDIWKMTYGMAKKAWWYCDKCNDTYPQLIKGKTNGNKCSICNGKYVTDANSLASLYPKLASEWHPTLNGDLTPNNVTISSGKKVWWLCPVCNSCYDSVVYSRINTICPYCTRRKVNHTNSLTSLNPTLANQWHPTKNGEVTPYDVTCSSHKKVWWLCDKGHCWDAVVFSRTKGHGCPYCIGSKAWKGETDMWTTNPELAKLLANPDDGYRYTQSSGEKVDWKCPDCGEIIKSRSITNTNKHNLHCPICSDGISYPEKLMYNLLKLLKIDFQYQKIANWSNGKVYDFYLSKEGVKIIIEVHGGQHYFKGWNNSAKEEQENDAYKYELAVQNGIPPENYIVIDCRKSELEFIKNNIINSKIAEIFDIRNIDWIELERKSRLSLVVDVCTYWNMQSEKSTKLIEQEFKMSLTTIIKYLKIGSKLKLCEYNKTITNAIGAKHKMKEVVQLDVDGCYINKYKSITEAAKNISVHTSSISNCCNGKTKYVRGYKWMFKDDYDVHVKIRAS